jgi:hypothetical protein
MDSLQVIRAYKIIEHYIEIAKLDYWYLNPEVGGPQSIKEIDFWYVVVPQSLPMFSFNQYQLQELKHSKLYKRARCIRENLTHGGCSEKEVIHWDAGHECCYSLPEHK